MRAWPPAMPAARTTTGGQPVPSRLSASTPRARRPSSSGWIGRLRMAGEPSTTKVPCPRATAAVRKRAAVPALPMSSVASAAGKRPSTPSTTKVRAASSAVTRTPSASSARCM